MTAATIRSDYTSTDTIEHSSDSISAVSWAAILGGAFAAAAITLVMLALGAGIGFSSLSPWSHAPASPHGFTVKTAIWFIVMQWAAAGLGGYLAGRLRTKWTGLHSDEVFFRDTAHGFLAWAVASIFTAALLASAVFSVARGGMEAASAVGAGAAAGSANHAANAPAGSWNDPNAYFVDTLFRSDHVNPASSSADIRAESARILAVDLKNDNITPEDKAYLAQLVSAQTGLSQPDAAKRVDATVSQIMAAEDKAHQAAEAARKTSKDVSFFTFFSMLIGAFIASVAGALGGKRRDEYK